MATRHRQSKESHEAKNLDPENARLFENQVSSIIANTETEAFPRHSEYCPNFANRTFERYRGDRRRKRIITLVSAVALIIVVLVAVYVTTRPSNQQFPFPCLGHEGAAMHIHPWLQITINNQSVTIPANIGIVGFPPCYEPVHTHDTSGILHIEAPDLSHNFTLGDFFTIWKDTYPTIVFQQADRPIIFNQTDILGFHNDPTHQVRLVVDGALNGQQSQLDLVPLDYCSSANSSVPPCNPTAGGDPFYPGSYPYGMGHTIQIQY